MSHLRSLLCAAALAGCASTPPRLALTPEALRGPVNDPPGKVLVISATCGSVEQECRDTWAPAVDGLVVSGLEFHGFATIDPGALRKDERTREETTVSGSTTTVADRNSHATGAELVGIIPVVNTSTSESHSVTVIDSKQKTVVLKGASFEDLRLEDRQKLTTLAQAGSVLTTRITVGANYSNWTSAQTVEVMIKLASPKSGEMLWSTRCAASSAQFPSVEAAIENAAKCAVSAITGP